MLAVTSDRETFAWGWNGSGQLGLGDTTDVFKPKQIDILRGADIVSVACGGAHTICIAFLNKFGSNVVYGWGANAQGQLGLR